MCRSQVYHIWKSKNTITENYCFEIRMYEVEVQWMPPLFCVQCVLGFKPDHFQSSYFHGSSQTFHMNSNLIPIQY